MSAHVHLMHHGHVGGAWKRWLVELSVFVLAAVGFYFGIANWTEGEFEMGLMVFGWFLGPAITYAFGYLWLPPDSLNELPLDQSRSMRQRWSDFVLLATFVAILVIAAAYARAIWRNYSYASVPFAVALVFVSCSLLAACAVASEKYLSWTMPEAIARTIFGWRTQIRSAVRIWGTWVLNLLGVKRAVVVGALLALLSLTIVVSGTIFGPEYRGYEIVAGNESWATVEGIDQPALQTFLLRTHRAVYVLGLFVAILALVRILPWQRLRSISGGRTLATMAGAIALFEITDIAIGNIMLQMLRSGLVIALWLLIWFVPVATWLTRALDSQANRDRTHLAVMVFYLPVFFNGFAFWVLHAYFSFGYGIFVAGMLLLWWGIVQDEHDLRRQQTRTLSV